MGAAAPIIAGVAIGGAGLLSSYLEGKAGEAQADFQANQMEFNAELAKLKAEDARLRGEKLAEQIQRNMRQVIGRQRVGAAAQGIGIDIDDVGVLQAQTEMFAAVDEFRARENASRQARGFEMDAVQYHGQAGFTRAAARTKAAGSMLTAGLSAIGSVAGGLGKMPTGGFAQSGTIPYTNDADRYSGGFDTMFEGFGQQGTLFAPGQLSYQPGQFGSFEASERTWNSWSRSRSSYRSRGR